MITRYCLSLSAKSQLRKFISSYLPSNSITNLKFHKMIYFLPLLLVKFILGEGQTESTPKG